MSPPRLRQLDEVPEFGRVAVAAQDRDELYVRDQTTGQVRRADRGCDLVAVACQVELGVERTAGRVQHADSDAGMPHGIEPLGRSRTEHGGAYQPPRSDAPQLPLDQADTAALHERHPKKRLIGVVEHAANRLERIAEWFDVYE